MDLLDRFDGILADAGQTVENMSWMLVCDRPEREQLKSLLLSVLNFTALLIEYSFSRHLYSSIEVILQNTTHLCVSVSINISIPQANGGGGRLRDSSLPEVILFTAEFELGT